MENYRYGRKRAGIKKELREKIEDWLASIDDESVRELAGKNTIVTGGSIASMLLGESVNDFDIYFRDKLTAVQVAKYYVEEFKRTKAIKMKVVEKSLTNWKGEIEERVCIAVTAEGAAAENEEQDESDDSAKKYRPKFISQNAITLSDKIQIVIRFYGEPSQIHNNYDYVHATCYWDHCKGELNLSAEALEAMLSRSLVYKGSLYPIASVFRMKKFLERGWRITAGEQLKIMWQISELDLTDKDILREQLTGVDMMYLRRIIDILGKSDLSKLKSNHVIAVIDEVFS